MKNYIVVWTDLYTGIKRKGKSTTLELAIAWRDEMNVKFPALEHKVERIQEDTKQEFILDMDE